MTPLVQLLLAAAGGGLYAVGHVGFGQWPLLFICLVPLWTGLDPRSGRSVAFQAGCGATFGAAAYVLGYTWLWWLVDGFLAGQRALAAALWLAHGLWFAAGFAAHAAIVAVLGRGGAWVTVASFVAVQWLQPHLFGAELGAGLIHAPWLAQTADTGGPLLLTAWVASVNAAVVSACSRWRRGVEGEAGILFAAAGMSGVVLVYGAARLATVTDGSSPPVRVGVVQANLAPTADPAERIRAHRRYLQMSRALVHRTALDLLVWPESAYGPGIRLPLPVAGHGVRSNLEVPLLFGGTSIDGASRSLGNAAFLVDADGLIRSVYRKERLIPFAEYLPGERAVPGLRRWFPHAQRFVAPARNESFVFNGWRLVTPICYEAVHAGDVRRLVRAFRPRLIVTLANDAWFGDSQEPHIHLALTRLRAIEHRRWIVRATNSGISAIIDPRGRIVEQTPLLEAATIDGTVYLGSGLTPYATLGDWPGWVALVALVAGAARERWRASLRTFRGGALRG